MKATITDALTLRALRPLEIIPYLRAKGWQQTSVWGDKTALWVQQVANETTELLVPLRPDLGDFTLRIAEVLQTLERVEQRSQLEILQDLATTSSDLVRLRAPAGNRAEGTIGLEDGVWFVERARDLMLAAACAALNKKSYFAKRKPDKAMDYLSGLRMGQTERGSFVLTILSPVTPELQSGILHPDIPDPYERKVTTILVQAIDAVRLAAHKALVNGDLEPFKKAVSEGVSANLCDALVGLAQISPTDGIDVGISWARTRAADSSVPTRIFLSTDVLPVIEEASRLFRETVDYDDFQLIGFVVKLDRPAGQTSGTVIITVPVENTTRSVHVDLDDKEYTQAIQAHKETRPVSCVGELSKGGKHYRLTNPRHFAVLAAEGAEWEQP